MKKRPFSNNANQVLETAFDAFPSKLIPYKHTMLVKYVHSFCASFNGPTPFHGKYSDFMLLL